MFYLIMCRRGEVPPRGDGCTRHVAAFVRDTCARVRMISGLSIR